ncbi:MAG TPA: Na+/H+ antiporter [Planctomycetota bacterium]
MPSPHVLLMLLAAIALTTLAAPRLRLPLPIALTAAGLGLATIPGLPQPRLDPNLILLVLLPPLLYADAFHTSWHDFRRWLRPILMLAVGLVAFTMLVVGLLAHALFPGLPWAACFALGAILSPTDTVATQAVLERLRIPRRATAILSGESLVNDATGLVGVQLCLAVLLTGAFELGEIGARFAWVTGGGVAVGLVVGACFAALNQRVREPNALFLLSLVSPYVAALGGAELGVSGVLAVVVAGFFVAWRVHHIDARHRTGLYLIWDQLVFVLNALAFLYIGLEVPALLRRDELGATALGPAILVALVVVLARFAWMLPMAYLPLRFLPRMRAVEGGYPPLRNVLLASWCGVRGSVSLAAALALPATLAADTPFPGRATIVFVTLVVVLVTLFAQGLTLGPLVRLLRIRAGEETGAEVRAAREVVLQAGIARLDEFCSEVSCPLSVHHLRAAMQDELSSLHERDEAERLRARQRLEVSRDVRAAVHAAQSRALLTLRDGERINDRLYTSLQLELDRLQAVSGAS